MPITSTKSTQYPTFTLTENSPTVGFLTNGEKAQLFNKFLNAVINSHEKRGSQDYSELLRDSLSRLKSKQMEIGRGSAWEGYNSTPLGFTQGADVNEPLTAATPEVTQLEDDDYAAPMPVEALAKLGAMTPDHGPKEDSDAAATVPNSMELERDNAQLTAEEIGNPALSVESSDEAKRENSGSSEGLSLASIEELRQANNTLDGIFDMPRENLYDMISDRLAQTQVAAVGNKSWPLPVQEGPVKKHASVVNRISQPRRNVKMITRFLNL